MPIPLIIGGIAIAAGTYGAVKGIAALKNLDEAKEINCRAQRIYDESSDELKKTHEATVNSFSKLGKLKLKIYKNQLIPFIEALKKIDDIDFQCHFSDDKLTKEDIADIEKATITITNAAIVGGASLGASGFVGLGAVGAVKLFGSTAAGTAIGGLGGSAATNATLAWFGGGALGTGFGMVGGIYVLGSIVAAPVLAVGGAMLASKAEKVRYEAYSSLIKARAAAREMDRANVITHDLHTRSRETYQTLEKLEETFKPLLAYLQNLVANSSHDLSKKVNYMQLSKANQKGIMEVMVIANAIKNIIETPIFDEKGSLTEASSNVIDMANKILREFKVNTSS